MRAMLEGENSRGEEILVDLNYVWVNPAMTNMRVATYPKRNMNVGNKNPVYEAYKSLRLLPSDKEEIEEVFKLEVARRMRNKKQSEKLLRKKKNRKSTQPV